jgi:small-conductance mechanosensitive channel
MDHFFRLVGPHRAVEILGIKLVGVNSENGWKLLFSIVFILIVLFLDRLLRFAVRLFLHNRKYQRILFWTRQFIQIGSILVLIVGLLSIWFDDPNRLATALGLTTAGLAFALQRVITAIAGYFVILRGKTFNVGDRIRMGGVRGDVIALSLTQTTIMEMGQPPPVQADEPAMWVKSRQYTGRIVTVPNSKIFDEAVYNYTRQFPYIWEEMSVPIPYDADHERAEQILLESAQRHTVSISEMSEGAIVEMERRYFIERSEMKPRVYFRLTDNWVELSVRFITQDHGMRELKDRMSRDILKSLQKSGISIASSTFEIVGLPPLRIQKETGSSS